MIKKQDNSELFLTIKSVVDAVCRFGVSENDSQELVIGVCRDLIAEKISEDIRGRIQDLTVNQLLFINETITTSIRGQGDRSKDKKSDSMGSAVKRRDKESYQ